MRVALAVLLLGTPVLAAPTTWVKITFGIGDEKGRDWSGRLKATGGQVVTIEPWGFETRHRLDAEKLEWVCDSEVKVARGRTRFAEPQRGVLVAVTGEAPRLEVNTQQGSFLIRVSELAWGTAQRYLGGAAAAHRIPSPETVASGEGEEDFPAAVVSAAGALWVAWVSWEQDRDWVVVRCRRDGRWGEPEQLAGPGDFYQVKLAAEASGRLWVVWAAQERGNFDLYACVRDNGRWSGVGRLVTTPGSDFKHELATDARGHVWMAWQSFGRGNSDIRLMDLTDPRGRWLTVTENPADDWEPALACDSNGGVWVAWDTYRNSNYDVYLRRMAPEVGPEVPIAAGPEFEAHPSLACDGQGRVWVAYDIGQPNWGKDYARGETHRAGNFTATLHAYRRLGLRCWTADGVHEAPVPIPQQVPPSWDAVERVQYGIIAHRRSYDLPHLAFDDGGNLWVVYRLNRQGYLGHPPGGGVWELYATWFDGKHWSSPILLPHSRGRNDQRIEALPDSRGRLWFVWPTGSHFRKEDCDIFAALVPSPPPAGPLRPGPATAVTPIVAAPEAPVIHRWTVGGETLRVFWGDLHRHTDISLCSPTVDGTLFDAYRYALDAARMDFLGVTDHTRDVPPYPWWRTQQVADLFTVRDRFAGIYSYERSNNMGKGGGGHRNLWFLTRGNPVFISNIVDRNAPSPAELYRLLRTQGIECAMGAHTPGYNPKEKDGTWIYSDEKYEPVAEIFQAYRTAYEMPKLDAHGNKPKNYQRYVWWALERGAKLGFIASSDHWSTHLSYACVYARQPTRGSLLEAIHQRRTYAAMDKILVEFSINDHPMGATFTTAGPVILRARVIGTAPLAKLEIVKDNRFVYSTSPGKRDYEFEYRDPSVTSGESYYYLRITQANSLPDGSPIMAWSSPVWVTKSG